jgi:predicted CoA-substrate-specific enzyme activase
MIFAGIDIGAATSKMVLLENQSVMSQIIIRTGESVKTAVESVLQKTLALANLNPDLIDYVVATGYGRHAVGFANQVFSEIICHARGAYATHPAGSNVIDIGGQDSKVIEISDDGNVVDFVMNDKCAAGTGRFLELIAATLNTNIADLGRLSSLSLNPCAITSTCAVFAESEVISLRADGREREDIIAGIHRSVAYRIKLMMQSVSLKKAVIFTGGVAQNQGVIQALQKELGAEIIVPENPQIMGALGAALLAEQHYRPPSGNQV